MPTVTLNKSVLSKLVGKKLSDDKLKNRISMLGTDLEKVDDKEITVEIFPNRPDLLSEQGFARALSSFVGAKTGLRKYAVKKSGYKVIVDKSVRMRPYMVAAIVKNVKFDDERIREIMQIQEKLSTTHGRNRKKSEYGFYPLERVNFPITYIAKDPSKVVFKPLGFNKEMPATKVEEIHPKGRAYKWLADEWKKKGFTKYPFLIDNKNSVMAMFPYTNSNDTGKIDENTTDVFIEATGIDLKNVMIALNILVTTLGDMGGDIYSLDVVYPDKTITTPNLDPEKMKVDRAYISKRIGVEFSEKELKKHLEHMGYGYEKGQVLIPAYRADIMHQVDLVEDVAIAYGYENLQAEIPKVATIAVENPFEIFQEKIRQIMVGLELQEVKNYHLMNLGEINKKMNAELAAIPLANANEEYDHLRPWIIPSLMKTLSVNLHNEYPQNIFEIGTVFASDKKQETNVKEMVRLGVVQCYDSVDFTSIKQILDSLLSALGLSYELKEVEHPSFIEGRVGRVIVEGKKVAYIGEISPSVLVNWGVMTPTVALEINLSEIWELIQ